MLAKCLQGQKQQAQQNNVPGSTDLKAIERARRTHEQHLRVTTLRADTHLSDSRLSQNLTELQEDLRNAQSQSETWKDQGKWGKPRGKARCWEMPVSV